MHLNHVNLPVADLDDAVRFLERFFGFTLLRRGGDAVAILEDGHGSTLVLGNTAGFGGDVPSWPEGFHVGFIVNDAAEVDAVHAHLTEAGHPLGHPPRRQHGAYGFYFTALGGILFEVATASPR